MITDQQRLDLEYLIKSSGWQLIRQYAEGQIKACQVELERKTFATLAEVALVQGKLQAFRSIIDYPETRIHEYMQKSKEA
jgi:hypothetical protein